MPWRRNALVREMVEDEGQARKPLTPLSALWSNLRTTEPVLPASSRKGPG